MHADSRVMTFIVEFEGIASQKDLGDAAAAHVATITRFDPDGTWTRVQH